MGLESGDFGAKKTVLNMLKLLHAGGVVLNGALEVTKLDELHTHYQTNKTDACIIVDGNVLVRASPQLSYNDFCEFISSQVNKFFSVADHVIVVFDEPDAVTVAKREEQAHRDAQRKKREIVTSEDILQLPRTDAYNEADIITCPNVHGLIENRLTRSRLMDMVFCKIMEEACNATSTQVAMLWSTLTLDGIDPRGDGRGHREVRSPSIFSTKPEMETVLRRTEPIGEGDMKLVAVEKAIEVHRCQEGSPVSSVRVILHHTIDTDSILINLIAEADRDSRGVNTLTSLLCLREPQRKRKGDTQATGAHYKVVDMAKLYRAVMLMMFKEDTTSVRKLGREAVALLAMVIAAAGCDFTGKNQIKGLRANELMCTLSHLVSERPTMLPTMRGAWSGSIPETLKTCKVMQMVLNVHGRNLGEGQHTVPAVLSAESYDGSVSTVRRKQALDVQNPSEEGLRRAAWVVAYWSGHEFKELAHFGFPY
jgi:hypothetical protein